MNNKIQRNLIITLMISFIACLYSAPNFFEVTHYSSILPAKSVNLGLDLKGGSHLLLKVDSQKYMEDQLEIFSDTLRKELRGKKIGYKNLRVLDGQLEIVVRKKEDIDQVIKFASSIDRAINTSSKEDKILIQYNDSKYASVKDSLFDQSIEIIRMRVDSAGTKEPIIQKQGDNYIVLQVPGEDNPEHLKKILGQTAKLSFHLVLDNDLGVEVSEVMIIRDEEIEHQTYCIKKPIITGDMLTSASATFDNMSNPAVSFSLNTIGSKLFGEATKNNSGKRIAIILDNKVLSAPMINQPILQGSGIITGNFSLSSAEDLALMLRAGALPAPLEIVEEKVIGASLGSDSVKAGKKAGIIGLIGVAIFMMLSYGILGLFANIALVLSLLYIIAVLSAIQATLTLPGIAGIILTIGMAVDANVLIYERIREESRKKVSIAYSVDQGFSAAFATIADSNITTLISASLLYIFGTGAVRGFAVSLSIGIISSMFTAIIVTRLLIDAWIKFYKPKSLGI